MIKGISTRDFRDQNPDIVDTFKLFKDLYITDPDNASNIIWSAYFTAIPSNPQNPVKNFHSDEERRKELAKTYCPVYSKKYIDLEDLFTNVVLDKDHSLYNIHVRKYEQFTSAVNKFNLTTSEGRKEYQDAMKIMEKLVKLYDSLKEKYSVEAQKQSTVKGGGNLSKSVDRKSRVRSKNRNIK